MTKLLALLFCAWLACLGNSHASQQNQVDEIKDSDKSYRNQSGVYGTITSIGSDTMADLMALWAERFQAYYPHVRFQIQAAGSATASQALTQGTAAIGPMSRAFNRNEIDRFESRYGYPPTALVVAIDAIGIYVERNNPLDKITLTQIDAVFSSTRWCGAPKSIQNWQQLGVNKFNPKRRIQVFGRSSISGTYDLFKDLALCGGDFALETNEMPSSNSVIQSVASSLGGIGYAALGQQSRDVKALKVSRNGIDFFAPNEHHINSGDYPFTRYLFLTVNHSPNSPLPKLEQTFLRFVLSQEGQAIVRTADYYAISGRLLERQQRIVLDNNIQ